MNSQYLCCRLYSDVLSCHTSLVIHVLAIRDLINNLDEICRHADFKCIDDYSKTDFCSYFVKIEGSQAT